MGRLTDNTDCCFLHCGEAGIPIREKCPLYKNCLTRLMYVKLKHYEDMEEQGRLIEVIRCDDCCHQQYCKQAQYLGADGYCSKAELKELEGDKDGK